ncbi:MAG: restriction endonuclease [gamma proteobacterium endosymbiont of Lamellibrachia anaximandri]|nr:restriction endonuclease [gamma proteobacterium endosymbiont of Lamellibrachia anaximandri]
MAIPDYQSIMLPLLQLAGDQKDHAMREATTKLADQFGLDEQERKELLPSGKQAIFKNRVAWARTYLKKAELLESPKRGYFQITPRGLDTLSRHPEKITNTYLKEFPEFVAFQGGSNLIDDPTKNDDETPEEALENAYQQVNDSLSTELIQTIKNGSPEFFERLVVDLLLNMGYGGSRKEASQVIGKSGDEGIDGIIKEDRLGLDTIYIQAKRWENTVQRPDIQKFAGALQGHRAKKGVFITTSSYSTGARKFSVD